MCFLCLGNSGTPVKVAFIGNTCGVPDIIVGTSTVQIRGDVSPLTWDYTSPARMSITNGEYWKCEVIFNEGDTVNYKFFTNVKSTISANDSGWEAGISDWGTGNRRLIVGSNDTTLPVQYVNGFKVGANQYEAPFKTNPNNDTVCLFLRVNMKIDMERGTFDPVHHKVGVRGSFTAADWGTSFFMSPQGSHANEGQTRYDGNFFYTVPVYFKKSDLQSASFLVNYKYVIHNINGAANEDWGMLVDNSGQNQDEFIMPDHDTTVAWTYYTKIEYRSDTLFFCHYTVNMAAAIQQKYFSIGDSLTVELWHTSIDYSPRYKLLTIIDSAGVYSLKDTVIWNYILPWGIPPPDIEYYSYRYNIVKNGIAYPENFVNTFDSTNYLNQPFRHYAFSTHSTFVSFSRFDTASAPSMNQMPVWTNIVSVAKADQSLTTFSLSQNYPNPFNPATQIQFSLPATGFVTLKVYDALGREVATLVNERKDAGTYGAMLNAASLSSGIYFYRFSAGPFVETKKMLLLK